MSSRQRLVIAVAVTLLATGCAGNQLRSPIEHADRRVTTTTAAPPSTTAAPTTAAPTNEPRPLPEPQPPDAHSGFPADWKPEPLQWKKCAAHGTNECARLAVPLNWSDPGGRQLELAIARKRGATTGDAHIGSLIMNPGGPGASGLDLLFSSPFTAPELDVFDQVSWDPRGVGQSTKLNCKLTEPSYLNDDQDPDNATEQQRLERDAAAAFQDCGTGDDRALLEHMGTDDTARDLHAIHLALGDKSLDYVGFSYGTSIGQRYLDLFPTHVRTMVLDGVVDPTLDLRGLLRGQAEAMTAALDRIFASCTPANSCALADAAAEYDRLRAKLEQQPVRTSNGDVGPAELAGAATYATYDRSGWTQLLDALAALRDGDAQPIQALVTAFRDAAGAPAYTATTCRDLTAPQGADDYRLFADQLRLLAPRLGGGVANEMLPCATWPVPADPKPNLVKAESATDILVVGNTGDPATPYPWAEKVASGLAHGHLLTYRGEGHTSYSKDPCVDAIVNAYLVNRTVPPAEASCNGGGGGAGQA
jgi:pimeloyl-ACP methyl ester carboxylesterase